MRNPNISDVELHKKCAICNNDFTTKVRNRLYCYDCSPEQVGDNGVGSDSIKARLRAIKHQLVIYKGGKCERCGYNEYEGAMQFHHLDPSQKDFGLGGVRPGKNYSMEDLYKEVDKCQLLCANCHAFVHGEN